MADGDRLAANSVHVGVASVKTGRRGVLVEHLLLKSDGVVVLRVSPATGAEANCVVGSRASVGAAGSGDTARDGWERVWRAVEGDAGRGREVGS